MPLGPDPDSTLEEFLHFETHAGEIPVRDDEGYLPPVTGDTGLVFVLIPVVPGERVWMGAQREDENADYYDEHAIRYERLRQQPPLDPFFLSKYEMTQGQWLRTEGENPSFPPGQSLSKPVNMVSWDECVETMHRLGLVLPDEVQWEFAARGGTKTAFWAGRDAASLAPRSPDDPDSFEVSENLFDEVGAQWNPGWSERWGVKPAPWRDRDKELRGKGAAPVGSYRANPFGLFDVGGNVGEWCSNPPIKRTPPAGSTRLMKSRIVRGGSMKRGVKEARSAPAATSCPQSGSTSSACDPPWPFSSNACGLVGSRVLSR